MAVGLFIGPRFSQLLQQPESIGTSRHLEVQDLTPVVADDEKAIQNTKRRMRELLANRLPRLERSRAK